MIRTSLRPPPSTSRTVWLVLWAKSTVPVPVVEIVCLRPATETSVAP